MRGDDFEHGRHGHRGAETPRGRGEGPCGRGLGPGHGKRDGQGNGAGKGLGLGKGDGEGKSAGKGFGRGGGHGFGFGGGMGRGRGHGRGRGRGPLSRLIAHGNLHLLLLHLIAEQPRHGYETIRMIEEMTGGAYVPSPGTIYPAFSMLEDQGFIAPVADETSRKRFAITEEGTAYLAENQDALQSLLSGIETAAAGTGETIAPQILRAAENLKTALELRLQRGPLDEGQIKTVADVLDRAAGDIEGS